MYRMKRFLALLLVVCLLSCSIVSVRVEAAEIVAGAGLTAASLFEICLFVGGVALTCYAAGEVIENREEIAEFGKNIIDSVSLDDVPDDWLFEFVDNATGQLYLIGSEVVEYIQSCTWYSISAGGSPDPDKKPGVDKDNIINFPGIDQTTGKIYSSAVATFFLDNISKLYQKWVNGEELTEAEQAVLAPVIEGYCDQNDIAKQWSGEMFDYSAYCYSSGILGEFGRHIMVDDLSITADFPIACVHYFQEVDGNYPYTREVFGFYYINQKGILSPVDFSDAYKYDRNIGGIVSGTNKISSVFMNIGEGFYTDVTMSCNANFPIFSSLIEAEAYLKGTGAVTDALNYAKTYQNADWLSDDWKGLLIDPLTNIGLSLSQLTDLAKALGVHAVGNNLSAQELADLLKQSLPAVNPDLLPDAVPVLPTVPDPGLDPIYYPHPNAHPLPTTPGTKPDPDPGKDPTPGADPDVDMSSYKVDLQGIFPFCIPFDFIALLETLDAEPVAPCFDFPVVIPALGYEETVKLDMSIFDDVAEVMRLCETVSFIIFLMFATSKVIKW